MKKLINITAAPSLKKKAFLLWLVTFGLIATNVSAQTKHCSTIEDCRVLKIEVQDDFLETLKSVTPEINEIWFGPSELKYAEASCQGMGMRLPTAREFALFAESRGAKGIRETAYPDTDRYDPVVQAEISQMEKAGYMTIYTTYESNKYVTVVDFYYNYRGYDSPSGSLGRLISFWSSTFPYYTAYSRYIFYSQSGEFNLDIAGNVHNATICVKPKMNVLAQTKPQTKHCHTIGDCRKLKAEVEVDFAELLKKVVPNMTWLLSRNVTHLQATEFCRTRGMRLPTTREFAMFAESKGAKGIRETAYPDTDRYDPVVQTEISQMEKSGYNAIYKLNHSQTKEFVDFYYNHLGYHASPELPEYYWCSEFGSTKGNRPISYAYFFSANNAELSDYSINYYHSNNHKRDVRCVKPN